MDISTPNAAGKRQRQNGKYRQGDDQFGKGRTAYRVTWLHAGTKQSGRHDRTPASTNPLDKAARSPNDMDIVTGNDPGRGARETAHDDHGSYEQKVEADETGQKMTFQARKHDRTEQASDDSGKRQRSRGLPVDIAMKLVGN